MYAAHHKKPLLPSMSGVGLLYRAIYTTATVLQDLCRSHKLVQNYCPQLFLEIGHRAKELSQYSTGNGVRVGYPTRMKSIQKNEMYMADARNLRLGPYEYRYANELT